MFKLGVCSECQTSDIELIYEDEHTVLQYHNCFNLPFGNCCKGSYSFPEAIYTATKEQYLKATTL